MALRWYTGFNGLNTSQILREFDAATGCVIGAVGRGGRQGVTVTEGTLDKALPGSPVSALWFGRTFKLTAAGSSQRYVIAFRNGTAGTYHATVEINSSRTLIVRNAAASVLFTSAALTLSQQYMLEAMCSVHDTTGQIILKLDETVIYDSGAAVDTRNGASTTIDRVDSAHNFNTIVTDMMYMDDAQFRGACAAIMVPVTGTVASTMTPSGAATDHEATDDNPADDDTTTTAGNTIGHKAELSVSGFSLPAGFGRILAVRSVITGKVDSGARTARAAVKAGSTTVNGTALLLPTSYTRLQAITELDGATGAAYANAAAVNATKVIAEVTA